MAKAKLKSAAELVGILAVLATLILIWMQLRQAQLIAVAELNVSLIQARVEMSGLLAEHSDVWLRGSEGDSLTAAELGAFEEIAATMDTQWFVEHRHMVRLGEREQAEAILNDYSVYLFERPGLRAAWERRQEALFLNRNLLSPGAEATFGWSDAIRANFGVLERPR